MTIILPKGYRTDFQLLAEQANVAFAQAGQRMDAGETVVFARELETIIAELFEVERIEAQALSIFKPIGGISPDSEYFTYRQIERFGKARYISSWSTDFPTAEVKGREFPAPIRTIGMAYEYSIFDIRRASQGIISLDKEKSLACRTGIDELLEDTIFSGSAEHGIKGLFSASSNITSFAQPGALKWDNPLCPAEQIYDDISAIINATFVDTVGKRAADTLLCGTKTYSILTSRRDSPTFKDQTVMQALLKSNAFLKKIIHWPRLDNAGAGGKDRLLAFFNDPSVIGHVTPEPFQQVPAQQQGLAFKVHCFARTGGIMVRHPKGARYMDSYLT